MIIGCTGTPATNAPSLKAQSCWPLQVFPYQGVSLRDGDTAGVRIGRKGNGLRPLSV